MNHILPNITRNQILAAYAKEQQAEYDAKLKHKKEMFKDYAAFVEEISIPSDIPVWDELMRFTKGKILKKIEGGIRPRLTPEERKKRNLLYQEK